MERTHLVLSMLGLAIIAGSAWSLSDDKRAPPVPESPARVTDSVGGGPSLAGATQPKTAAVPKPSAMQRRIERLADGDPESLDALRDAFRAKRLSLEQLLAIVYVHSDQPEVTTFQERVWSELQDRVVDLAGHFRSFLKRALEGDAHVRAVATQLASIPGTARGRIKRRIYDDDEDQPPVVVPVLAPSDLALVEALLRKDHAWRGLKASIVPNLDELGPEAVCLTPWVFQYLADIHASRRAYMEKCHAEGILVHVSWGHEDFDAAWGLARLGPDLIPHLRPYLENPEQRAMAELALASLGPKATAQLLELAAEATVEHRRAAIEALGAGKDNRPAVLDALRRALQDDDDGVRERAARGLVLLRATDDVKRIFERPADRMRWSALNALWYGEDKGIPKAWHAGLLACMRAPGRYEDDALFKAAEQMGAAAAPATEALLRIATANPRLSSPDARQLFRAIGAGAAPHLVDVFESDDAALAALAVRALLWLPEIPRRERKRLADWLDAHESAPQRATVAAVIARDGGPLAARVLADALREGALGERVAAAEGIGRTGAAGGPHLRALVALLKELSSASGRADYRSIVTVEAAIHSIGAHDLDAMVNLLADGHADEAGADVLKKAGSAGVDAILRHWEALAPSSRRRALPLLATEFERTESQVRATLDDDISRTAGAGILLTRTGDATLRKKAATILVDAYIDGERSNGNAAYTALSGSFSDAVSHAVLVAFRRHENHTDVDIRKRIRKMIARIEDRQPAPDWPR